MTKKDLEGRVALVTGGSRGIGRAACFDLATAGAAVAVNYRSREDAAQEVVAAIVEGGGRAEAYRADVGERAPVAAMVEQVVRDLGSVDILINNAGIVHRGTLLAYDDDEFDAMWQTNVKGVLHCAQAAAPLMVEKGWGRISMLPRTRASAPRWRGRLCTRPRRRRYSHSPGEWRSSLAATE